MFKIEIPGFDSFKLEHLVLDYNGTLAKDGKFLSSTVPKLQIASRLYKIHVITADTFGNVQKELKDMPLRIKILHEGDQAKSKLEFVKKLGLQKTAAIGNGRNDRLMLLYSAIGVGVMQAEGVAKETLMAADIVCKNISHALDLIVHPKRLVATLRS